MHNEESITSDKCDEAGEEQNDVTWQELIGIVADPPDQRDICESCR